MKTIVLPAGSPSSIARAVQILGEGGIVAFPTDTVYGLGAAYLDEQAVLHIYSAKARSPEKAIPILMASADQMGLVCRNPGGQAQILARRFWPGPLTIVVPKHPRVPRLVALDTVGLRVPDHAVARDLILQAGPLAVTSANISGGENPVSATQVVEQLDGRIDLILDGGVTAGGIPSTVVDCTGDQPVIVRPGPLSLDDLRAALR